MGTRATFAILGNHDYGLAWSHPEVADRIAALAAAAGVKMLRNEVAGHLLQVRFNVRPEVTVFILSSG
jgi:predicted MPP superfamily phosphohydrolase